MDYSGIKKAAKMNRAAQVNRYKNGGEVAPKKSGTTVNIVVSPARGEMAAKPSPIAPAGNMAPPPSRMPSPPVPPVAAQAGLEAMGAGRPPMFANGGKVKSPKISINTSGPDAKPMRQKMEKAALSALDKWHKPHANGGKVGTPSSTAAMTKRIAASKGDTRGNIVNAGGSGSKRKVHGPAPKIDGMYANGGKVSMDAGAGGAKGRLEKIKDYGHKQAK